LRLLITGNMGYVGPPVVRHLREALPQAMLAGFDAGYFAPCLIDPLELPERELDEQFFGDMRSLRAGMLDSVSGVVHLAGISNDPIGNAYERVTNEVNADATVALAAAAKAAGVRSFVFASSCSVYGCGDSTPRTESSETGPLTAYAQSKLAAEQGLRALADSRFRITCLRFATGCGFSPRLRLDLVLNDFVASAIRESSIRVLSDGTPWRPLIHVRDMARAIEWAVNRDDEPAFLALNAGSDQWNYQVMDLAEAVAARIPGIDVYVNRNAAPDRRSYRVDFSLFRELAPAHQPRTTLEGVIDEMAIRLREAGLAGLADVDRFSRLRFLGRLTKGGRLTPELRWAAARTSEVMGRTPQAA
jgi:nucleoside-diphosphate-sugar epimerase